MALLFVVLVAGIVAAGSLYYQIQKKHYRTKVEHDLSTVADLKAGEIALWRQERLADAGVFYQNPAFAATVRRYLENPGDVSQQQEVRTWIRHIQISLNYDKVRLLDTEGKARMSFPDSGEPQSTIVPQRAREVLRTGKIEFMDFYRHDYTHKVHLSLLVPIFDDTTDGRPLGVLQLRIDPEKYLYSFIQRWPTPSQTAETLLVRRDGNDVLFLNELKFQTNTALNLRLPLTSKDVPVVKAAFGQEGIVEGTDYRRVPVLAAVRAVPDSPWFLVARMDVAEVFAPQREHLWPTVFLVSALLIGAGVGVGAIWWQQRAQFYKERYRAEEARAKLAAIVESSDDAIIGKNLDGTIISWNTGAERLLGYRAGEIIGQSITRIIPPDGHAEEAKILERLQRGERIGHFETVHIAKDGRPIDVSLSASPIRDMDGIIIGASKIVRDITERRRAEQALRESEERFRALFEQAAVGVALVETKTGRYIRINQKYCDFLGYTIEEMLHRRIQDVTHPDDAQPNLDSNASLIAGAIREFSINKRYIRKDGTVVWGHLTASPLWKPGTKTDTYFHIAVVEDITERRRAEVALSASEIQYRRLFEAAKDGILILDA